jgi:hypothetical protein
MLVDAKLYTPSKATHTFLQSGKTGINTLCADIDFVYFDDAPRTTSTQLKNYLSGFTLWLFKASFRQFWYRS